MTFTTMSRRRKSTSTTIGVRRRPSGVAHATASDLKTIWRIGPSPTTGPERIPVTEDEVDLFERWFGDLFDELFGPRL
jgi:hypothetical protein